MFSSCALTISIIVYTIALASAPFGVSLNNQFFLLCSVEHKIKNRVMIDTVAGAKSSAIIYSIAETAKANNLKPYDYFEYLLTEIPEHLDDTDRSFLDDLLPWSPNLPANCRKPGKDEVK